MKQILIKVINVFKRLLGINSVKTEKVLPKCETKEIINKYQRVASSENRTYRQTETKKEEYRRNTENINLFPIVDTNDYSSSSSSNYSDTSSHSHTSSGFSDGFGGGGFGGGGAGSSWSDSSSSSSDSGSSYDSSSSCDNSSSSSD
jgi:uncharacterized membrane protein YgcG